MALNFSIRTRFDTGEHELISRLLKASEPQRNGTNLFRAVTHALLHGRSAPVDLASFCRVAEDLTGEALTCQLGKDLLRWAHGDEDWVYPCSLEKLMFFGFLTAVGPTRWLTAKYTLPGFVELEADDVVVDCGAFVGGFTIAALRIGASVIAVEPSRTNRRCLQENLRGRSLQDCNVDVQPLGLGPQNGEAIFRQSSTGVDSTFGILDEGVPTETYLVEIATVDHLCERLGVRPTFLKVEAEGLESKILQGLDTTRPAKVAVDASPEGGSDDRARITRRLKSLGYAVRSDLNMIYGRL